MADSIFEILKCDLAGRIGRISTNHGTVSTPAYVPVIHPAKQTVPTSKIKEMGFDLVITNAYITYKRFKEEAAEKGIHDIIGFDGAVMTDSGGYQVLEYGDVDIMPPDMAEFERQIGTDFAIPLDKPTGFRLSKKTASRYVTHTLDVSKKTLDESKRYSNGQIWVGPIQGGEHSELVSKSTKALVKYGYDMLALGSPVEFMESYEYNLLAQMIISAKRNIPHRIPLHLFGAGHPLTIPWAVALGCDTFDSASYMLYAKKDRYITEDRTRHLSEMEYFACPCEVCSKNSPKDLLELDATERINKVALHNLYSIKAEVDRTKEAINEGRLWEYVLKKIRSHPKLFEIRDTITKSTDYLSVATPKFKEKAVFLFSKEDQYRPEVASYHEMVRRFKTKKKVLVVTPQSVTHPAYLSAEYRSLERKFKERYGNLQKTVQFCQYSPVLGIIPLEISDVFPAAHNVESHSVRDEDPREFPVFEKTWMRFFENNNFEEIYFDKSDSFLRYYIRKIRNVRKLSMFI